MPTPEQVQEWRALRGRFLSALWDAEHRGADFAKVSTLLAASDAPDLPDHLVWRIILNLNQDGLIEGLTGGEPGDNEVRLTSAGRYEVEQWIGEPDQPTEHLPLPASQVFNIGAMNVSGPVLQGSTATNVVTSYGMPDDVLRTLVTEFRKLLSMAELTQNERETIEADLGWIEDEAATPQPRPERIRPLLQRLQAALFTGALGGVQAETKQGVTNLIGAALQTFTG